MPPTIHTAVDVCQIHRPALVAGFGSASQLLHARPGCNLAWMLHSALAFHQPVNLLAIDLFAFSILQQRPNPTIAISRMLQDELVNPFDQPRINLWCAWRSVAGAVERTSGKVEYATDAPSGSLWESL